MLAEELTRIASKIRLHILTMTHAAGSGHPTSCFSLVDLAVVLYFRYLRFDLDNAQNPNNDRVIFSKGHASALLYALYAITGKLSQKDLTGYRMFESPLEGHPTYRFPYAEAATGSLGQGLSIACGEAWGIRKHSESGKGTDATGTLLPRVYCLLGDGELAEGSVWEAAGWASHNKLGNLTAIVDVNRYGQASETMLGHDMDAYRKRFESYGWVSIVIDGHKYDEIIAAFDKVTTYASGPSVILAKTLKGKGVPEWEDKDNWHNRMLPKDTLEEAIQKFEKESENLPLVSIGKPPVSGKNTGNVKVHKSAPLPLPMPALYDTKTLIPTKRAFGNALVRIGKMTPNLMVLDADMANSVHLDLFREAFPQQFLEMYISEQNMAGVATGLAKRGFIPVVSTFASFLTRAHDQIRMMPLSNVHIVVGGTYVGASEGRDGPSQMGLEDLAMMRSLFGSTVVYPADPYATELLTEELIKGNGVCYIRTTREPTPVIYGPNDKFTIGGSHVFPPHTGDAKNLTTIITAGITLHEALIAQKTLTKDHIPVRVIDCYSIKPIDIQTLQMAAKDSTAIVIVEDHYPEGGLGEAVLSGLSGIAHPGTYHMAVRKLPMSGSPNELLSYEDISADAIIRTIRGIKS